MIMTNWIIPANGQKYNHAASFQKRGYIDWAMKASYQTGDTIYIYCTVPYQRIMFKALVEKINLSFLEKTDDKEFWLEIDKYEHDKDGRFARLKFVAQVNTDALSLQNLIKHGLPGVPQRPIRSNESLSQYIDKNMDDYNSEGFFTDVAEENHNEGLAKKVYVNKYERSSIARGKCIEFHGCKCSICEIDFEQEYGEVGKGFIHVHHKTPISDIGEVYVINYKNDLIPICPNCHAMLHRKINDKHLTIDELKAIIEQRCKNNNQ